MIQTSLISHLSSLISHPSSLIPHPSSLIPHRLSLIPHPLHEARMMLVPRMLILLSIIFLSASEGGARAEELHYPLAIATHGETIYLADRNLPGVWKSEGGKLS